jgi:hypothetical protein
MTCDERPVGARHRLTLTLPASAASPSVSIEIKYAYCGEESCVMASTAIATVTMAP